MVKVHPAMKKSKIFIRLAIMTYFLYTEADFFSTDSRDSIACTNGSADLKS